MYIHQKQLDKLQSIDETNKVVVIYGPRRVGKTTLLKQYLKITKERYLLVNGEDINAQYYLSSQSIQKLKDFLGDNKLLIIDEAQKIDNIGLNLKLIVDDIEKVRVIASGSSTFDLAKNIGEPLTGRKITLKLFPLSQMELNRIENLAEIRANLEKRLIFGSYPEIIIAKSDRQRQEYLHEIVSSYLYKDILEINGIKKSKKLIQLIQLLAFQIGKEVSLSELGRQLDMSKNTVERYLDLLEQVFVIINIGGFSRNLRKEITKMSRYYFYDNGIRNALINNFNLLHLRNDRGELWENYIIIERIKKQHYQGIWSNNYFWRTYNQKEIDWVEEREGRLFGYEIKWSSDRYKEPKEWKETYNNALCQVIYLDNYLNFIT
jgi:predicted AAA+ superfamily ATPase